MIDEWVNDIHQGDALDQLKQLPESSIHSVITSPPYYGLRDYGVDGQIGLEETLDEYVQSLVDVGEELKRVLRNDGNWWLNLGDSFGGDSIVRGGSDWTRPGDEGYEEAHTASYGEGRRSMSKLGRKNKMLVPHRVAIALQDSGWIVRSDAVWAKENPMPSPVKDRLREDKEMLFHLTQKPDYWFDLDAIRESHAEASIERAKNRLDHTERDYPGQNPQTLDPDDFVHPGGKNPGDIFNVTVQPFPEAHFAVYPPELIEKPIKSTVPPVVCADCGAPYERVSEQVPMWERELSSIDREQTRRALEIAREKGLTQEHFEAARDVGIGNLDSGEGNPYNRVDSETAELAEEAADVLGSYYREALMSAPKATDEWEKQCDCDADETEPGVVLDPFAGAGTTALEAKRLGRRFIGIDLNPEYVAIAQKRVGIDVDQPELLLEENERPLQAFANGGQE